MNAITADPTSVNDAIASALRRWSAKFIAGRVRGASLRTIENWREGKAGPQAKHLAVMLQDDVLCPALLKAIGRDDLAADAEIRSLNRRIEALKADEARHQDEAHAIRRTLESGGSSVADSRRPVPCSSDPSSEDS